MYVRMKFAFSSYRHKVGIFCVSEFNPQKDKSYSTSTSST